jgi:aryl-alcohol dehydrogenase-like predicted oxidoreductase
MLKNMLLGTAQWSWTMNDKSAFEVLDAFYESGFRQIDSATNYPINKIEADFRQSEKIITAWIQAHGVKDLKIMMKIGSLNNNRTPECNLSPSFLLMSLEYYRNLFQENLDTIMIHWDNREDKKDIFESLEALKTVEKEGFEVGISGIKHPELYAAVNQTFNLNCYIQIKHNILQSDYARYVTFHNNARFIAYGINAGGVKLNPALYDKNSVLAARGGDLSNNNDKIKAIEAILAKANENKNRPPITDFFQVGMLYAVNSGIENILVAPSNPTQWQTTLDFYNILQKFDYQDIKF